MESPAYPQKTSSMHNHHMDSTVWDGFKFRPDDIIIATYAKSGTTWTQQIVSQLIFDGTSEDCHVADISPWVDMRFPPKDVKIQAIEAQTHRRFLKTHLPVDSLNFSPTAKYIYVARDARDVVWSMYNHHSSFTDGAYHALNDTPGLVGPRLEPPQKDVRDYWREWMARDGHPWWPFWDSVRSWWRIRHLPNVLLIHFSDLKQDMGAEIRRIAAFLDIPIRDESWENIVEHCSFDWMKTHGSSIAPTGGDLWEKGAESFMFKGVNGRWKDLLTEQECVEYEKRAVDELGEECADWLRRGGHVGK